MSVNLKEAMGFSDRQYDGILAARVISSFMSLVGSLCIIRMASRKRGEFYHRLMLALSVTDALSSFVYLWNPFAMPRHTGFPYARGNEGLCAAVGFVFHTLYSATCILTAVLSLSYVLIVRYRMSNERVAQICERPAYVLATMLPLIVPIICVINGGFGANPVSTQCSFIDTPPGCDSSTDPNYKCIKGTWTIELVQATNGLRGTATTVAVLSVLTTLWTVYRTSRKQLSYSFGTKVNRSTTRSPFLAKWSNRFSSPVPVQRTPPPFAELGAAPEEEFAVNAASTAAMDAYNQRMRRLCKRSCLYVLAYFNTVIWQGIIIQLVQAYSVFGNLGTPAWYSFLIAYNTFIPLQGAFNLLIYTSAAITEARDNNKDASWFYLLYHVIANDCKKRRTPKRAGAASGSTLGSGSNSARSHANKDPPASRGEGAGGARNERMIKDSPSRQQSKPAASVDMTGSLQYHEASSAPNDDCNIDQPLNDPHE